MTRIRWIRQLRRAFWGIFGMFLLLPAAAFGQIIASDSADPSDPAYSDGWQEDDNGGFGFQPWTGGMYANPFEIDTDPPEPDSDLGTPAFRYGSGGFGYWAIRPFAAPMQAGESFSMDFDQWNYSFPEPTPVGYFSNDSLLRFSSTGGERFSLYNWQAKYNDGVNPIIDYGAFEWAIGADTAFDNLNGGAPLPLGGAGFMTGYTGADSTDGFTITLDIVTIDTYRLRIVDDGATKVDVSGTLRSTAGTDPPVDITGQGIGSLTLWSNDATGDSIDTNYFTNLQIVETPSAGVDGDYNDDGTVDAADYVVWRKHFGTTNAAADGNGNGIVDAGDYTVWRDNFGAMAGGGSGFALAGVPEPSSLALVLLGCAAAAWLRRTR